MKKILKTKKVWVGAYILGCMVASACSMFCPEGVVIAPPEMPGATYVGQEACKACHCEEHQYFDLSSHADVTLAVEDECGEKILVESCETCHGPGSLHIQSGGDPCKIINSEAETCFACHLDVKGSFSQQFHHPVPEGQMTCSDCHSMHGDDVHATGMQGLNDMDQTCLKCHKGQKGPFAFEHEAMRDGCTACHSPHGSIVDRLLIAGPNTLCLSCHFESSINSACSIGSIGHEKWIGGPSAGSSGTCIDCHTAVHGSNHGSTSLRD